MERWRYPATLISLLASSPHLRERLSRNGIRFEVADDSLSFCMWGVATEGFPAGTPKPELRRRPGQSGGWKWGYTMAAYRYNYPQLWPFKWRTWWNIMINKNKPAKFWGTYFQTNPNVFSWPEIDRTIRTQIRDRNWLQLRSTVMQKQHRMLTQKKYQTYNDKQWCTYQHSQRGAEWIISLRGHEWTPLRTHVAKKFQRAQIPMSAFQYAIQGTQKTVHHNPGGCKIRRNATCSGQNDTQWHALEAWDKIWHLRDAEWWPLSTPPRTHALTIFHQQSGGCLVLNGFHA